MFRTHAMLLLKQNKLPKAFVNYFLKAHIRVPTPELNAPCRKGKLVLDSLLSIHIFKPPLAHWMEQIKAKTVSTYAFRVLTHHPVSCLFLHQSACFRLNVLMMLFVNLSLSMFLTEAIYGIGSMSFVSSAYFIMCYTKLEFCIIWSSHTFRLQWLSG